LREVFRAVRFPVFVRLMYMVCRELSTTEEFPCMAVIIIFGGRRVENVLVTELLLTSVRFRRAVYSPADSVILLI
jgi:hypothetical protein